MSSVIIEYNGVTYEGFEEMENFELIQEKIAKEVNVKGYYKMNSTEGYSIIFPYNILINSTIKLVAQDER